MTNERTQMQRAWRIGAGIGVLVLLLGVVIFLARPSGEAISIRHQLQVVAAENFWGDIARQIGGNTVHVTSIITDPNTDPHLYESSARDASAVASAQVVITNGLGYDDFMTKLLGVAGSNNRTTLMASQIMQASKGSNPHLWYDLPKVDRMAQAIRDAYSAKDPAHVEQYNHNLIVFDQELRGIVMTLDQIKTQFSGTPVAYTEPVPAYLLSSAGLTVETPEGFAKAIEDGTDPSPTDAATMDTLMTSKAVKLLLYNSQATSPVTERVKELAQQAGIPVVGVSEIMPHDITYQSWQQGQISQILHALEEQQ